MTEKTTKSETWKTPYHSADDEDKPKPAILVVEDEATLRHLARRILEPAGYVVHEAADGQAGLIIFRSVGPTALVIADVDMPNLTGDEMVRRIRLEHPELKVLFVTGHIDRVMDARPLWEDEAFLEKPYTGPELLEAVSMLLYGTTRPQSGASPRSGD